MPRTIDPSTASALAHPNCPIGILVDLTLSGGTLLHVWSGYGNLDGGGALVYAGVGQLGKISVIDGTSNIYAAGATLTLEGVNPNDLNDGLQSIVQGLPCTISLATIGPAVSGQWTLIGTPIPVFAGLTDQVTIQESATTTSITVAIESKLAQLQRDRSYRYTDQMQRFLYPGDGGLKYVSTLHNFQGSWGYQENQA